ncbi:hypothetical protein LTR12_006846 [Friedmanniomyces endolithicus]|nr:hypothetical protein LTR74_017513 [Friedmanniomyces endolithicus]KAK1818796.1 hypothetical protein LTR12_006846 [Friedmanniomyces endolithicus]
MSHQIHTCTLPEGQRPTACKACRDDELKEVGSWASEALRGLAQGHIVPHAQQVPFDADAWFAQARGYPESTNWWKTDRENFDARRHPAAHNLHRAQNNHHPPPAPQAAQRVNMQVPARQAANQAPPQVNGTHANDAADTRPRIFRAVKQRRRPATVHAGNVEKARSVAHQQAPGTSKIN